MRYTFLGHGVGRPSSEEEMFSMLKQRTLALQSAGSLASK